MISSRSKTSPPRQTFLYLLAITLVWCGATDHSRVSATPPSSQFRFVGRNAQGYERYENRVDGTILIRVPATVFTMGSSIPEAQEALEQAERYSAGYDRSMVNNQLPAHRVHVNAFFMARTPVTNAQFRQFVASKGHAATGNWQRYAATDGEQ